MNMLPPLFIERLEKIIPREYLDVGLKSFSIRNPLSVRINSLKTDKGKVTFMLRKQGISYKDISWCHDALVLEQITRRQLSETSFIKNGFIFMQSLSSMLVPLILNPKPGDHILDMCAAPGGKTTQMAAMMRNQGSILAIDSVKARYYKLKSVISLLGAHIVIPKLSDARRFSRGVNLFDRILIDAPCSCEGRFEDSKKETYAYWSLRKIKEMSRKQKELMLTASRLLKTGGILVYSTCTFAPEENEAIIDWFLQKTNNTFRVIHPDTFPIMAYSPVKEWNNKQFNDQVCDCLRILPNELMEGFFVAKLMKII